MCTAGHQRCTVLVQYKLHYRLHDVRYSLLKSSPEIQTTHNDIKSKILVVLHKSTSSKIRCASGYEYNWHGNTRSARVRDQCLCCALTIARYGATAATSAQLSSAQDPSTRLCSGTLAVGRVCLNNLGSRLIRNGSNPLQDDI